MVDLGDIAVPVPDVFRRELLHAYPEISYLGTLATSSTLSYLSAVFPAVTASLLTQPGVQEPGYGTTVLVLQVLQVSFGR